MKFPLTTAKQLLEELNPALASEQNIIDTMLETIKVPALVAQADAPVPTPMVESEDLMRLLVTQGFLSQDADRKLNILVAWMTGRSTELLRLYTSQRQRHGQILQDLGGAVVDALKKGVHDRRQHLEAIVQEAQEHLNTLATEEREILGVPPAPKQGKWIPISQLVRLLINPDWYWGNNNGTVPCKYVIARIDTRDNSVLLADGDGRLVDIAFLEESCRTTGMKGMNENTAALLDEIREEAAKTSETPGGVMQAAEACVDQMMKDLEVEARLSKDVQQSAEGVEEVVYTTHIALSNKGSNAVGLVHRKRYSGLSERDITNAIMAEHAALQGSATSFILRETTKSLILVGHMAMGDDVLIYDNQEIPKVDSAPRGDIIGSFMERDLMPMTEEDELELLRLERLVSDSRAILSMTADEANKLGMLRMRRSRMPGTPVASTSTMEESEQADADLAEELGNDAADAT